MVENIKDWMDEVKVNASALPDGKGIVAAIYEPEDQATKYGDKKIIQIVINGSDGSTVHTKLFLPPQFPELHPKCNLSKILKHYGCKTLKELIGKEVKVVKVGDMMWKILGE